MEYNIDDKINIKEELLITIEHDKEPYIKKLTNHNVINLTGESGSGKSYFANQYINDDNYIVVDTDEIFSRYTTSSGINKALGTFFRNKYKQLPSLFDDFDKIYLDILNYFKDCNKTIIIDSAQFRNMKNISLLVGEIIVIRTSVDNCYKRCIERYNKNHPNASIEDKEKYRSKKIKIYDWYKTLNKFLLDIDKL